MIIGPSNNFIQFFREYITQEKLDMMNICIHGRNLSNDFIGTISIDDEETPTSLYNKILKVGGLHSLIKIYNPSELYSKMNPLNRFNFGSYINKAEQKKYLKKVGSQIILEKEFFISLDEGSSNDVIFGSRGKSGHLIDIDYYGSPSHSRSAYKTYEVDKNRMIVNVDAITNSQQQRKNLGTDIGFYVINNDRNYISSLGLRGISIELMRRNEIGGNVPIL